MSTQIKLRKIAILEFYEHSEVLTYLHKVLHDSFDISVFTSQQTYKNARLEGVWFEEIDCLHKVRTLKSIIPTFESFDGLIVLTTMVDHRPWMLLESLEIPKAVLVHNGNWMFGDSLTLLPSTLLRLVRRFKWAIQGSFKYRLKVAKLFDAYIFPSAEIAHAYRQKVTGICFGINWAFSPADAIIHAAHLKPLLGVVVIPGTVDFSSRAYEVLVKALSFCSVKELEGLDLILLGSAHSREAQNLIKNLNQLSLNLISYQAHLSSADYEQRLRSAEVILNLQREEVAFATTVERYSKTKVSGVVNDAIRHAKQSWIYKGSQLRDGDEAFDSAEELADLLKAYLKAVSSGEKSMYTLVMPQNQLNHHRAEWNNFMDDWLANTK